MIQQLLSYDAAEVVWSMGECSADGWKKDPVLLALMGCDLPDVDLETTVDWAIMEQWVWGSSGTVETTVALMVGVWEVDKHVCPVPSQLMASVYTSRACGSGTGVTYTSTWNCWSSLVGKLTGKVSMYSLVKWGVDDFDNVNECQHICYTMALSCNRLM